MKNVKEINIKNRTYYFFNFLILFKLNKGRQEVL